MQTNQVPVRRGRPSIQQGLIFGVIVGIVFAINTLLTNFANIGGAAGLISILLFLVGLFLYAVAGFRASAQTGRVGPGAIAGLLAGAIGGIIGLIVSMIAVIANVDKLRILSQAAADQLHRQSPTTIPVVHYTNSTIITSELLLALGLLAFAIGMGAAFGAIGGAIGRRRAPQAQVPYQEQFYQGMPPASVNSTSPYNQGYPQNGQGYSPNQAYPQSEQVYPQNPGYAPNNQENPYPYNQPPQPNPTNPSDPYAQGYPPAPPSEDRQ